MRTMNSTKRHPNVPNNVRIAVINAMKDLEKTEANYQWVAKVNCLSSFCVKRIWLTYKNEGRYLNKPKGGSEKKFDQSAQMTLVNLARWHYHLSQTELCKLFYEHTNLEISRRSAVEILHNHGVKSYKGKFKPILSQEQMDARLKWCLEREHWTVEDWKKYVFTDECGIHETGRRNVYFLRRPDEGDDPRFFLATKNNGGFFVSVWGGVSQYGLTPIVCSLSDKERWDADHYLKILKQVAVPFLESLDLEFQQDNASTHTAEIVQHYFDQKGIEPLPWSPHSPDLSIIENIWHLLKLKLPVKVYENRDDFVAAIRLAWTQIGQDVVDALYESIPNRIKECIEKKGGHTHY
ncbi:DDE_superfamily endonuclease domain-containing protein [Hexamita inflata]|uniref:DDE_superfamily endonuclease domain-containing protein n=1 Tax=Hexamita inflata TaxID=28002 RepID=A0ABP1HAY6_9EUKA